MNALTGDGLRMFYQYNATLPAIAHEVGIELDLNLVNK